MARVKAVLPLKKRGACHPAVLPECVDIKSSGWLRSSLHLSQTCPQGVPADAYVGEGPVIQLHECVILFPLAHDYQPAFGQKADTGQKTLADPRAAIGLLAGCFRDKVAAWQEGDE
jgi:hypothetical protein